VNKDTYTAGGKIGRALGGSGCHEGAKSDNDGLHFGVDIVKNPDLCSVDRKSLSVNNDNLICGIFRVEKASGCLEDVSTKLEKNVE
jgi:hypothetical protein